MRIILHVAFQVEVAANLLDECLIALQYGRFMTLDLELKFLDENVCLVYLFTLGDRIN